MIISEKELEDFTKKELQEERNKIIAKLNNAGINPDLSERSWHNREGKTRNYNFELNRLNWINKLLGIESGYTDIYKGLEKDSKS